MARWERTEAKVRRAARRLRARAEGRRWPCCSKRRGAHEHGGRMREGWVARGAGCATGSARVEAAVRKAPTAVGGEGVKGALRTADGGERSLSHTLRHFSAARGGACEDQWLRRLTKFAEGYGALWPGRANGLSMSRTRPACGPSDAARRPPRPRVCPEGANCSRRDAVALADFRGARAPGLRRPRAGSIEELAGRRTIGTT